MNEEHLLQAHQFMRSVGPANCWTGTTGSAAAIIHALLKDRTDTRIIQAKMSALTRKTKGSGDGTC